MALEIELGLKLGENAIAHLLRNALKITGHENHAIALGILEGERLHPQVMQLAVGRSLRAVTGEPDAFLRRDDRLGDAGFPGSILGRRGTNEGPERRGS